MRLGGFSISCSKVHSDILFYLFPCIQVIPFWFSISYVFLSSLSNARLRNSVYCFFINIYIINIIYIVLTDFRINVFMLFSYSSYSIILIHDDLINCIINNIIVLFLSVNFIFSWGVMPVVLSRPTFRIPRTKVSQDLTFIWWISRSMDETN